MRTFIHDLFVWAARQTSGGDDRSGGGGGGSFSRRSQD